uniref:Ribosome biogenesis regulatory protein n=2 Tax=Aegilops tauschii subsp. strangulata TaxID=200361 RepID=A0A452XT44_AEGTS
NPPTLAAAAMAAEEAAAATNFEVDLGHLLAYDPSHHLAAGAASSRAELRDECLRKATELAQAVANALFSLPATEGRDGPLVRLPPPTNRLPREKHLPRPKPPTKWEQFAKSKGEPVILAGFMSVFIGSAFAWV